MNPNLSAASATNATRRLDLTLLVALTLGMPACSPATSAASRGITVLRQPQESQRMKVRMDVDGAVVTATLDNSAASRDFAALLPLSLTLNNYARIERIADLPRKLSLEGAPAGVAGNTGDITFYAPWGNLAIFVEEGEYARGLVRLGRVESGLPALQRPGPLKVRIERIEE
jgi:hypothetical protein